LIEHKSLTPRDERGESTRLRLERLVRRERSKTVASAKL
jgi:hypothetical protein